MPEQPIRIFDGPHQPHEPFWTIRNQAGEEPEMEFYGFISEFSWFGDEITPAMFKADLYRIGNKGPVTIRMDSAGGDVMAASVIRSILVDYPGRVTVRIDGLAASAATIVATAGDVVKMQDSAFFMIHNPWTLAIGGEEELKDAIELLKTVKSAIIDTYEIRSELSREKLAKMMTDETWMTAAEAKEYGFVDEVIGGKHVTMPANAATVANAIRSFVNVPAALRERYQPEASQAEPPDVSRLRAEVQLLV